MVGHAVRIDDCPEAFMRLMYDILWPFTNAFMVVYLDDILFFIQSWEENLHHIWWFLQTLHQHNMSTNFNKCTFGLT